MKPIDDNPNLGELITNNERRRDAIHIAVAPVTAGCDLSPGQDVGFIHENDLEKVGPSKNAIGIVDPFLKEPVLEGQRFWLFLYPGTVIGMRHYWKHPAFQLKGNIGHVS